MKRYKSYFVHLLAIIGAFLLGGCHGQSDDHIIGDPTQEVPEGVLRIFADKTTIAADGSDLVTFTVMFGSEDVSTSKTLQLVRIVDGNEKLMNYGVNTFSTTISGTYIFKAEFYRSGRYYSDNEVEVVAEPNIEGGDAKQWIQKILGFQFTSVGCTFCPELAKSIKMIYANYPDRMTAVSFHQDFNGYQDVMTHPMTNAYYKLLGRQGLPQFCANLIVEDEYIAVNEYDKMLAILDRVESEYPATCGVAIESSMVVGGESRVKVKVRVTSNTPSQYRYQIFLVEDGIEEFQAGIQGTEASEYVHNNVVRVVSSDTVYGSNLNEGIKFQEGVEVTAERTLDIPVGCNLDNMRVVVAALVSYDGGNSFVVNNCAECPLGQSVDYAINE